MSTPPDRIPLLVVTSRHHDKLYRRYFKPGFDEHLADAFTLVHVATDQTSAPGDVMNGGRPKLEALHRFVTGLPEGAHFACSDADVLVLSPVDDVLRDELDAHDLAFISEGSSLGTGFFFGVTSARVSALFERAIEACDGSDQVGLVRVIGGSDVKTVQLSKRFHAGPRPAADGSAAMGEIVVPLHEVCLVQASSAPDLLGKYLLLDVFVSELGARGSLTSDVDHGDDLVTERGFERVARARPEIIFGNTLKIREQLEDIGRRGPCVLVTHADASVGDDVADRLPPNVRRWFTRNAATDHPRVQGLPIGVHPAYQAQLCAVLDGERPPIANLVYMAFTTAEGMDLDGRQPRWLPRYQQRDALYRKFSATPWVTSAGGATRVEPSELFTQMRAHHYVLSPPGIGPDCYRHWEAMALGAIPIVLRSKATHLLDDLPCLQVESFDELSEARLLAELEGLQRRFGGPAMKKLRGRYWEQQIVDEANAIANL